MCLAIPGKIIEINRNKAIINYKTEKRTAMLIEKNYKVGDYVIVQAGVVLQKLGKKEAEQSLKLFKEH